MVIGSCMLMFLPMHIYLSIYLSISLSLSPPPSQRFNLPMYPMLVIIPLNFGRNLLRSLPISSQNAAGKNASAVLVDSSSHSDRSNALLLRGEESTCEFVKVGLSKTGEHPKVAIFGKEWKEWSSMKFRRVQFSHKPVWALMNCKMSGNFG